MSQSFIPSQSSQRDYVHQPPPGQQPLEVPDDERGTGGAMFAAALMIISGCFGALEGLSYIIHGSFYVKPQNYWVSTNAATWGWWHLAVGVVVAAAGVGIIFAVGVARWVGIILVGVQAITNFAFIPVQPFWAIALVLIDLWIIHSLFIYRRARD